MRGVLRVGRDVWSATVTHLHASPAERMAYLFARVGRWRAVDGTDVVDFLVARAVVVPDAALSVQSPVRVAIDPAFTRSVLIDCYETGLSLVDVHTHPFATDDVQFSSHDRQNMRETHGEFLRLMPAEPPVAVASLVVGQTGVAGCFSVAGRRAPRALDAFEIVHDHIEEVSLCR